MILLLCSITCHINFKLEYFFIMNSFKTVGLNTYEVIKNDIICGILPPLKKLGYTNDFPNPKNYLNRNTLIDKNNYPA